MAQLEGKTVVLGVTGGISAYKAAELCRLLQREGASVRVVMTRAACEFVTPLTMQTLSGHPVGLELFDLTQESQIGHIRLADEADLVIVAPATADALARMAAGMADDLLAAVVLATRAPVLLAPAMNVNMWENPLVQENLRRLLRDPRLSTVGPDRGPLACGWIGAGRLVEPAVIAEAAAALVGRGVPVSVPKREAPGLGPLRGRRVLVTAGPTYEPIDDVRFLGNRSSGKMGFAIARAAAAAGAEVTLLAGPVALATPPGVAVRIDFETATELKAALAERLPAADALVMSAAVSDFRPAARAPGKLSRRQIGPAPLLALDSNPDLLAEIGHARHGTLPFLVGFAAELAEDEADLVARGRAKLAEKRCDAVVANDVGRPGLGFGSDRNAAVIVFADGDPIALGPSSKDELAEALWNALGPALTRALGTAPALAAGVVARR